MKNKKNIIKGILFIVWLIILTIGVYFVNVFVVFDEEYDNDIIIHPDRYYKIDSDNQKD